MLIALPLVVLTPVNAQVVIEVVKAPTTTLLFKVDIVKVPDDGVNGVLKLLVTPS